MSDLPDQPKRRPKLPLQVQSELEQAADRWYVTAHNSWPMVFGRSKFMNERRPAPATFMIQYREHAAARFDMEARHYAGHTRREFELREWLDDLSACLIAELVMELVPYDSTQNIHSTGEERIAALFEVFEDRVRHWTREAKTRWLPVKSPDPPISPLSGRGHEWHPIEEPIKETKVTAPSKSRRSYVEKGKQLRALRQQTPWTQEELAEKCGWHERTVLRHENGQTRISKKQRSRYEDILSEELGREVRLG